MIRHSTRVGCIISIYILSCHPIHRTFVPVSILTLLYFTYLSSIHLSILFLDFPMVIYSLSLFMMLSRNPCVPHVLTSVNDHVVQYKCNGMWQAKLCLLGLLLTLRMEAVCSSEMSVNLYCTSKHCTQGDMSPSQSSLWEPQVQHSIINNNELTTTTTTTTTTILFFFCGLSNNQVSQFLPVFLKLRILNSLSSFCVACFLSCFILTVSLIIPIYLL
jgi:hypothetical protein